MHITNENKSCNILSVLGKQIEMFCLNSTFFGTLPVLVFQLEVYNKVDRLLTGLTAKQKGSTARWYSNKTSLPYVYKMNIYIETFAQHPCGAYKVLITKCLIRS